MTIQVGSPAPEFAGTAVIDSEFQDIKLSDYKGKWVVLFFYPMDFTFVCPTEITAFSDRIKEFEALNVQVVGASVDHKYSHLAWKNTPRNKGGIGDITFPLLADITKQVSQDYGVLLPTGVALRGLFLIDPDGKLVYQVVHDLNVGRSVDETLRVIKAFQYSAEVGEVCPANWSEGADTMKEDPVGSKDYFASHAK